MIQPYQVISLDGRVRRISATDRRRRTDAVRLPTLYGRQEVRHIKSEASYADRNGAICGVGRLQLDRVYGDVRSTRTKTCSIIRITAPRSRELLFLQIAVI
jgi:hypothetical protein